MAPWSYGQKTMALWSYGQKTIALWIYGQKNYRPMDLWSKVGQLKTKKI